VKSHAKDPTTSVVILAMMADVEEVEVVVAHSQRATMRVGDVFLKIDADQSRIDVEVAAMAMVPVPTPEMWRKPPGRSIDELASRLAGECAWLVANDVLPPDVVTRHRRLAETALRSWTPVFIHGDLQVDHVFVAGDEVTGVIDWSEASQGDALFDLATLTLGHEEHLDDVVTGYGTDVDRDRIRAWSSLRCLSSVRWLAEHGFGPTDEMPEVAVLRSRP
jgi:aminoglycoside phosphotransferase (APT) family kinase protein